MATLGFFDANSITDATANGFVSLGDGGTVTFNLTSAVDPAGKFLYFGEVGGNGETISGNITVSDQQGPTVPEPATILLFGTGLAGAILWRFRRSAYTID
ncbi:MAG: PEP-CTERM sorting domain-containing protein [Nitrospirota bacterium]